jgi:elongation factor G
LTKQTAILNTNQKQRERVSKLLLLYASEVVEVDTLPFGSIGIILGLKHTRTGDTLVSAYKSTVNSKPLASIVPPLPVMSASIIPQSQSDLRPVQDALQSLVRTDPSVRVDVQDDQILIHGLGALHLEIVEGRLREEWDVRFQVGKRRVSYREGLGPEKSASTPDTYSQVIAGTTLAARVDLELRSLLEGETSDPAWDGNVVVDAHGRPMLCTDLYEPNDIRGQVARGIANTLSNSPHTSLHISRVHIQVKHFSCLTPETTSAFLAEASASILRDALLGAGIGPVMEPYIRMKISVPEDSLGRVLKDLTESGGQVLALTAEGDFTDGAAGIGGYPEDGVYVPPDWVSPSASLSMDASSPRARQTIQALAPLGGMLDYSSRLRALSGGYGVFETTNVGFTEVSESRKKEILSEISQVQA